MIRDCANSLQWVTPQSSYLISRVRPPDGIHFGDWIPIQKVVSRFFTTARLLATVYCSFRTRSSSCTQGRRGGDCACKAPSPVQKRASARRRRRIRADARRSGKRKEARSFVRTSPFVQSQRGPKNTRSRLATSRAAPPAALVRCPAPLTGRGRSPLSPRPPLVNPTRRHFSSPRHAAPLTARSCPRRGRWGPPWAPPPPASPAGSQ